MNGPKSTKKTRQDTQRHGHRSDSFMVKSDQIQYIDIVFLLSTLKSRYIRHILFHASSYNQCFVSNLNKSSSLIWYNGSFPINAQTKQQKAYKKCEKCLDMRHQKDVIDVALMTLLLTFNFELVFLLVNLNKQMFAGFAFQSFVSRENLYGKFR